MNSKKDLFLFTANYPYSLSETFLENELPILAFNFNDILISTIKKGEEMREMSYNAKVIGSLGEREGCKPKKLFFKHFFLILNSLFIEFLGCDRKLYFLKNIRKFNSQLIRAIYDANFIIKRMELSSRTKVFYSVWLNDWALALAVLKQKGEIKNFIIKCGGFDIYDERHEGNYLPFRYFIYKNASAIFPNSKSGEIYLKNKNMFSSKIQCSYLGTHDHGINPFSFNEITIVSCSSLIPLKRIHLIIEILKHIEFNLKWVHFGAGSLLNQISESALSLPKNIVTEFKGQVANQEILEYYSKNSVSLFITTSETEGLPISLQEAISFGIPVVGTNVGGIAEVVNEETGFLIDKDFSPSEVAELIKKFIFSTSNMEQYRKGVREFWERNFKDEIVYSEFCKKIDRYSN
jgi:glycosyltransferase involved in cell wall biosynthesis